MPYTFHRYAHFFYLLSDQNLTMYQDPRQVLFYAAAPVFISAFWSILEAVHERTLGVNERRMAPVFPEIGLRLAHIYIGFKVVNLVFCLDRILQGVSYAHMGLIALDLWIESIAMDGWFILYILFIFWLAKCLIRQDTLARIVRRQWYALDLHRAFAHYKTLDLPILAWH